MKSSRVNNRRATVIPRRSEEDVSLAARVNLPKIRVILSGVPSGAKAGRNEVEEPVLSLPKESRRIGATSLVFARDPSTELRPPFPLRSAQDDTYFGQVNVRRLQESRFVRDLKPHARKMRPALQP